MLVHLNIWNARVRDVPSRPIYGVGERSGIRLRKVIPAISWLLIKRFWWRLWQKYVIRDFHPLVFFYVFGLFALVFGLGLGVYQIVIKAMGYAATAGVVARARRGRSRARHSGPPPSGRARNRRPGG